MEIRSRWIGRDFSLLWNFNIMSSENSWTDGRRDASGNKAARNFPPAEKLHRSPSLVDFITPSYSFVSTPLSLGFLISLHSVRVWLFPAPFRRLWKDKNSCWLLSADDHTVSPAPFYPALTDISPTLSVSHPLLVCFARIFCRFISKSKWFVSDSLLNSVFCQTFFSAAQQQTSH